MDRKRFLVWLGGIGGIVILIIVAAVFTHGTRFFTTDRRQSGTDGFTGGVARAPSAMPYQSEERSVALKGAVLDMAAVPSDKRVIKSGYLGLVVEAIDATAKAITAFAEHKGGFVESLENSEDEDGVKHAALTIRIPVAAFSEAIETIKAKATLVEIERVSGQDVTEQYIDLQARLKNLRATETQYLEILKRAFTVEDTLKVTAQLTQVRGQIESLEGQLKYLTNQTDLATVTVALSEEPTLSVPLKDFRPRTVLNASVRALVSALVVFFNVLVRFVIVWIPILLLVGAIAGAAIYGIWTLIRRFGVFRTR
ncbi:MAG: DUF4349 domain-containing protein [bacterium]|nr:DUF4349 domain-containing protein [bacterium]MDZ4296629.1 DUF4349 domain-containing protein [Patescibacteria group bacterium]